MLVCFGLVSIASIMASPFDGQEAGVSDYLEKLNLDYVKRQIVNFLVGLAGMIIMLVFDYQVYRQLIKYAYVGILGLLLVLFVLEGVRGVQGWFVFQTINRAIQPGELAKVVIIIALADEVSKAFDRDGRLKDFKTIVKCVVLCGIPTVLVMLQPDFGTAFVFICILVFIFFMARISWRYIIGCGAAVAIGLPLAYKFVFNDDQRGRIDSFLNPELDPQGSGYNVLQAQVSIGSGQMYGKGFFSEGTLAQLKYVPERHTDFIFAGIVEGVGFVGGTILIVLFFVLIFRWMFMAAKAKDSYGAFMIIGGAGMLTAHVFENIGMNIGLMPVTGIPLPFISYGGSNLLTNMLVVGVVQSVWMRHKQKR